MKSLEEIKAALKSKKEKLYRLYPIKSMAIFGSYARNEQNEKSDVDIIVEFNGRIGLGFIELANKLEKLIGLKVDLVSRNGIKKHYFNFIKEDMIYV